MNLSSTLSAQLKTPTLQEPFIKALECMILSRTLENRLSSLYKAGGKIVGGVYLGRGQEAFSAACTVFLNKQKDIYSPLIRDQAGRIAFGEPIIDCMRTYLGVATGPMRGRDGNIHRGKPAEGTPAMISHLGSMISVVNGMLFARRLQNRLSNGIGATSIGDGGTSTGAFHEGINQAAVENLPLVVSVANNQFAYSTPNSRQFACKNLIDRALGYGAIGYEVEGRSLLSCLSTFSTAITTARSAHGVQMVVGNILRIGGHGEHDDASYMSKEIKKEAIENDCIEYSIQEGIQLGWITREQINTYQNTALALVDEAQTIASNEPIPNPYKENWCALASQYKLGLLN
jgi:pyruvate dehydrogenase E1 component alpha subunit/2-oxoisovalerate dehydrogenase E1 component alpha subunit